MVTLAYGLAPFVALAGTWLLLLAHDGTRVERAKAARAGIVCLVAALLLVAAGVAGDRQEPEPVERTGQPSSPA